MNNILAGMTGNLYLAKQQARTMPDVVNRLDAIEELAFRGSGMISQLLTFARKSHVDMKKIPLEAYMKEVLTLLAVSVPENIKLTQSFRGKDLQICGDSTQIHQILMNIINNARDALADVDKPEICIGLEAFTADDAFVQQRPYHIPVRRFAHIMVSDNGSGIPKHLIPHLFEPFFTTKEQGKGTGLGLAMVYGAVKGHNGFVEVESTQGMGSIFHIYLPLLESEATQPAPKAASQPLRGNSECILLVDDELNIRTTGHDVLVHLGYKVLTAENGQEAVEIFDSQPDSIDLVILDVVMPIMSGPDAWRHIRAIRPDAKVLFSTGYDKSQALNSLESGMEDHVISKPLSITEMSLKIRQLLD